MAVNGDSFTSNGNYGTYLLDVVADIKQRVDDTYSAWTNGYRETFVANTGTAAGTSLSLLTNQLNQHYEAIKRDKIGIPSGALTLGFTNPESVEAYYSGYSIELAVAALNSSRQLYLGNAMDGTAGIGFDDYLTEIGAEKSGIPLDEIIQQQYTATIAAVAGLANPLSATVDTDTESVVSAYNETVKQIVNIKTDMPSVLCVAITYIDNPSDSD